MSKYLRSYADPFFFSFNGLLSGFTLSVFLDGFRKTPVGLRVSGWSMTQLVDGSVTSPIGVTTVELFKVATGGGETSLGTLSLTQGGGAKAMASTTTVSTEALRAIAPDERVGVKLTSAQTAGTDLSISVFFGQ